MAKNRAFDYDYERYPNWIDPKDVKPYPRNAKLHPPEQVATIVNSITRFGWQQDTVLTTDNVLVVGHGRRLAALEIGCMMPYHRVGKNADELTDAEIDALRLADNKVNESGWDFDALNDELAKLSNEFDMTDFGFDAIEDLTDDAKEAEEDDFDVDAPVDTRAKLGDIWQLGRHRLMCGDSTDEHDVETLMNGQKVRFVFTDPPWNVNYGAEEEGNPMGYKPRTILNDFMGTEDFKKFMLKAFGCMNKASEPGAMTYVVMSAQEWGNMMLTLAANDYHWSSTIIWNKDQLVLSRKDSHTKYEPIWYGWKSGEARLHPLKDRKQCDVWDFDRPKRSDEHPTMKPVELVAKAMDNSSNKGDNVLDLFGGSGTTLIAAEQLERKCYMMELDPHYVDVILARWEQLTGEQAVLLNERGVDTNC